MTLLLVLSIAPTCAAGASELEGSVHLTFNGQEKSDRSGIVVFVADQALPPGHKVDAAMAQAQRQFTPDVLVVPVGTTVSFPNRDKIEHNVFARSPHASFDLGRYGKGGAKSHTFDEPGVVDVYCNVHSDMIGHVVVVPGPWAVTERDGSFVIRGLTPGRHAVVVWDRLGTPSVQRQSVTVPESGPASLDLSIVETDREPPHPNKFGGTYRTGSY
jgi:plastocyanin